MNKAILIGTVDRDAVLRKTDSGTEVCTFTVVIVNRYTNKAGENKEARHYQPVAVWGKAAASACAKAAKGALLSVQGRLSTRAWKDQAGQQHSVTEVVADLFDGITRLDSTRDDAQAVPASVEQASPRTSGVGSVAPGDDEVPF